MSSFLDYLRDISDGAQNSDIAKVAGVNKSTVGRWDTTSPSLDAAKAIATRYQRPVAEVLIAAGLLEPTDLRMPVSPLQLGDYSNTALLRELERRLDRMSPAPEIISETEQEDPNPDDYDLAAGHVQRPDDRPAD